MELAAGDALILYTDGLVERRGEAIDVGLQRLVTVVKEGSEEPQALCTDVLESTAMQPIRSDDDVTVVAVRLVTADQVARRVGGGAEHLEVSLPADLGAATAARRVLEQSFARSLDAAELERAKLAVSELVTNAVRHGQGEITLRAQLDEARLFVAVIDQGPGFEPGSRAHSPERLGGWGLQLVEGATSRWGMEEGASHVWFEIHRSGGRSAGPPEPAAAASAATSA